MSECLKKSLLQRLFLRLRQECLRFLQGLYLLGYAIPSLWFSGVITWPLSIARGYESFLLLMRGACVKLAISRESTLQKEYRHYQQLKNLQPRLGCFLPSYQAIRLPCLFALKYERLFSIAPDEALPFALAIQKALATASTERCRLLLEDCPQIEVGVRYLEKQLGLEKAMAVQQFAAAFLACGQYEVGLAHGDFHSRNIMKDAAGGVRMIDLDCVRFRSVRAFDALYFALEQKWSACGQLWTATLADCLAGKEGDVRKCLEAFGIAWSDELGAAFFLDRLGQDVMNYQTHYPTADLTPIVERLWAIHNEGGSS